MNPLSVEFIKEYLEKEERVVRLREAEKDLKVMKEQLKDALTLDGPRNIDDQYVVDMSTRTVSRLNKERVQEIIGEEKMSDVSSVTQERRIKITPFETEI